MEVILRNNNIPHQPLSFLGSMIGLSSPYYGQNADNVLKAMGEIIRGHNHILEHINLTWDIQGISRTVSHQLVRHRHASFTQLSQHYTRPVTDTDSWYITPPTLAEKPELEAVYKNIMHLIAEAYDKLLLLGSNSVDARYLLPNATYTALTVTFNLLDFRHAFNQRDKQNDQWELKEVFDKLLDVLRLSTLDDEEWQYLLDYLFGETPQRLLHQVDSLSFYDENKNNDTSNGELYYFSDNPKEEEITPLIACGVKSLNIEDVSMDLSPEEKEKAKTAAAAWKKHCS